MSDTSKNVPPGDDGNITDYLHADFDDLIFERRNKAYGGYLLRKKYHRRLIISLLLAIALLLITLTGSDIYAWLTGNFSDNERLVETEVNLTEAPSPVEEMPPPPPPSPPPAAQPKPEPEAPQTVKKDEQVKSEPTPPVVPQPPATDTISEPEEPEDSLEKEKPPVAQPSETPPPAQPSTAVLEQMPTFPGGQDSLLRLIYRHIRYPDIAREKGVEGIVYVKFIVEKDGSVSNVQAVNLLEGGCSQEAARVARQMPKWSPGRVRGQPVKVQMRLPIEFRLTDE